MQTITTNPFTVDTKRVWTSSPQFASFSLYLGAVGLLYGILLIFRQAVFPNSTILNRGFPVLVFAATTPLARTIDNFLYQRFLDHANPCLTRQVTAILTESQIVLSFDEGDDETFPWERISKVIRRSELLVFCSSGRHVAVVPESAFHSEEELQEVFGFLRSQKVLTWGVLSFI